MLQIRSRTLRALWLGLAAVFLFAVPAQAANTAYLIHDRSDVSRSIFAITGALDEGSAGMLLLQQDNDTYPLPVYRVDPGATVTLQGGPAQLRAFPIILSGETGDVNWNGELSPSIGQMQVTLANGARTIAASEFKNYVNQLTGAYIHEVGAGFRLNDPGYYLINHTSGGLLPSSVVVQVVGEIKGSATADPPSAASSAPAAGHSIPPELADLFGPVTPTTVEAEQNAAPVLVNGKKIRFDAYTIQEGENGFTYFKLRDLAAALSGTDKQFEVYWDKSSGNVMLTAGNPYTMTGSELTAGTAGKKPASPTTSVIYKDGLPITPAAYLIGQNNYFKLRDIAELFNFSVEWDNDAMCILIDTSKSYTP